ncbi:MAG: hypothetical protein AAF682_00610 [Planctomycetota bacterium]
MDFTRSINATRPGFLRFPMSWILGAHWLGLIVLPYFLVAAWADAAADPDAWRTHRCWGQPHVVWLGLCNAGLLIFAVAELRSAAMRAVSRWKWAGYAALGLGLVTAQLALWRWVEVVGFLTPTA